MEICLSGRRVANALPALVMGIVNATDDSFFAASRGGPERALSLVAEGADIIDVGAESTRPGSGYVSEEEEVRRLVPVVEAIRRSSDVPISVDTRKLGVMRAARAAGADVLNDVSALEDDPRLAEFCAAEGISVVLMHKRGVPATMQGDTSYSDVFAEVDSYLRARAEFAIDAGIPEGNVVVDPGIGFGKDAAGCAELVRRCGSLCGGRFPVLMALSRKSFIGAVTGRADPSERLFGTLAADIVAVQAGASIVRVHDVAAAVDSLRVLSALGKEARDVRA